MVVILVLLVVELVELVLHHQLQEVQSQEPVEVVAEDL
tara:strand:- start:114 stop:227 length:114 start_codon:yes stop_codon:yes gene_type:complete